MEFFSEESLLYLATFLGIILATILVAFLVNRFFSRLFRNSSRIIQNDPTNYRFLRHALVGIIYVVGVSIAIYAVPDLRTLASSLLAGAGILAVAVGFASQHALSNIISGVFIVIFKPFRVNDRLFLRDRTISGVVEDITLRHTVIRDFENRRVVIPNSLISDEVILNSDLEDERIIKWVELGISYESDVEQAKAILQELAENHPLSIDGRTPEQIAEGIPKVVVRVIGLGEYSVNLRAWVWANNNADAFAMGCDLLEQVKKRYQEVGIEIPYPHRTLVQKG